MLAIACPSQAGPGRGGPVRERSPALLDDAASRGTRGPNAGASGCGGAGRRIIFILPLYMRGQLHRWARVRARSFQGRSPPHAAMTAGTVFPCLHRTFPSDSGASIHRRGVSGHHPPRQFIRVSTRATQYAKLAARAVFTHLRIVAAKDACGHKQVAGGSRIDAGSRQTGPRGRERHPSRRPLATRAT
jgi:hypothetical protein